MNKQNIKKWVEALESGRYKQGSSYLATIDNEYCCLGVACEVAIENGVPVQKKELENWYSYDSLSEFPPSIVMDWIGIPNEEQYDYTKMNDEMHLSFKEIAEEIRKRYEIS